MKNENLKPENFIYHHNGAEDSNPINLLFGVLAAMGFASLIMLVLFAIGISLLKIEMSIQVYRIGLIIIGGMIFYAMLLQSRKTKSSYKIYDNRIEFFNERTPLDNEVINLREIDQVRYEDLFGDNRFSNAPNQCFMYCYFKNGYQPKSKKIKKDRLRLKIEYNSNRVNNIIKILQFFKEKKKQIYISTKHSKINTALNIKNWTQPQIRL